jgi:hypothetical protein
MWNQWIRLPGWRATTGPFILLFLNQERHGVLQAVRFMYSVTWTLKSLTAAREGAIDLMPWTCIFFITLIMYFAACSTMGMTDPWPIGAFGPRNTSMS